MSQSNNNASDPNKLRKLGSVCELCHRNRQAVVQRRSRAFRGHLRSYIVWLMRVVHAKYSTFAWVLPFLNDENK